MARSADKVQSTAPPRSAPARTNGLGPSIDGIPVMDFDRRNAAKRFIILVDTFYDNAVKLVASADAEPDALYRAHDGFEAQEFKRTASRLIEMRSDAYLALPHGRRDSQASSAADGIVET